MYYDKGNMDYIRERLTCSIVNTVVDEPFYVDIIKNTGVVEGYYLKDLNEDPNDYFNPDIYTKIDVDDIDLVPVKLGCVNYKNRVYWTSRQPIRDWKQGLTTKNIKGIKENIYLFKPLYYTIKGIYPSFEECLPKVGEDARRAKAFSRNFHIENSGNIFYKGRIAGSVVNGSVEWLSENSYLNERFLRAVSK